MSFYFNLLFLRLLLLVQLKIDRKVGREGGHGLETQAPTKDHMGQTLYQVSYQSTPYPCLLRLQMLFALLTKEHVAVLFLTSITTSRNS